MLEFQIVEDPLNPKVYKKYKLSNQNQLAFIDDTEETYKKYLEL